VLGNAVPHLHTHIVPRYADDVRPGWPFPFPDPEPPAMPEGRLRADLAALRGGARLTQPARPLAARSSAAAAVRGAPR
jgi:diadenosine tetraphosphate (Ap4A) HIT family hydrolase